MICVYLRFISLSRALGMAKAIMHRRSLLMGPNPSTPCKAHGSRNMSLQNPLAPGAMVRETR